MRKISVVLGILSILSMLFIPGVFANELSSKEQLSANDVSKMVDDANFYKNEIENQGGEVESSDCILTSPSGEKYTAKAYPTSEPVLLNDTSSLMSSLAISNEVVEVKEYAQTYVVEFKDSNIESVNGISYPGQQAVFWAPNGSLQAYSTAYYDVVSFGGNECWKIVNVDMGWNIVDSNIQLRDQVYKAITSGPGFNPQGIAKNVQQELPIYSNSNRCSFQTGFTDYVDPDFSAGVRTYQSCYANRANQGWWYIDFIHQLKTQ